MTFRSGEHSARGGFEFFDELDEHLIKAVVVVVRVGANEVDDIAIQLAAIVGIPRRRLTTG